jgi:hypothetical protein
VNAVPLPPTVPADVKGPAEVGPSKRRKPVWFVDTFVHLRTISLVGLLEAGAAVKIGAETGGVGGAAIVTVTFWVSVG